MTTFRFTVIMTTFRFAVILRSEVTKDLITKDDIMSYGLIWIITIMVMVLSYVVQARLNSRAGRRFLVFSPNFVNFSRLMIQTIVIPSPAIAN